MKALRKESLRLAALIGATAAVWSCTPSSPKIPADQRIRIPLQRLDSAMFAPPADFVKANIAKYRQDYASIFDIYTRDIIRIGVETDPYFADYLDLFLAEPLIRESYDSAKVLFGDFSLYHNAIEEAFSRLRVELPDLKVPEVFTMISAFNEPIAVTDTHIGISLDKFLGEKSIFYQRTGVPVFLRKRLNANTIPAEAVRSWLLTEYPHSDSANNLANTLIYHGKIMYLMDIAFPDMPDRLKIGFTDRNEEWMRKSEKNVWSYLIEQKLLFSTDRQEISKYVRDAPFVATYGEDSPGRLGVWLGWQIVRSYMRSNNSVDLIELIKNNDHQSILVNSKYNPK